MKKSVITLLIFSTGLAALAERNVRIVDYGADMAGYVANPYRGQEHSAPGVKNIPAFMDKDDNGSTANDTVSGWQLSFTDPINFPIAPFYDLRQKSSRLYGGIMLYAVNNSDRYVTEGFMNCNHASCDDFNFMGLGANKPIPEDELLEGYALWFWQKPDFLNDGNEHTVRFNDESYIAAHISRYWGGIHSGRWVVRDGDQFFVSKQTFGDFDELIDGPRVIEAYDKKEPVRHHTYILHPGHSEWSEYHPREADGDEHSVIDFDAKTARFYPHKFKDVSSVGFLVTRELSKTRRAIWDNLSRHQAVAVKWCAFRCDAVVDRPEQPGYVIPMTSGEKLAISEQPISFEQWETIRRIGVVNQYCYGLGELGYSLISDGMPGPMDTDDQAHNTTEPVMGITWLDAVAWCNILSEFEGLEPAYYTDAACTGVLRRVCNRSKTERLNTFPTVYWKQSAEGFRLPTDAELADSNTFKWEGPDTGNALLRPVRGTSAKKVVSRNSNPASEKPESLSKVELLALIKKEMPVETLNIGIAQASEKFTLQYFSAKGNIGLAGANRNQGKISEEDYQEVVRQNTIPNYNNRTLYPLELSTSEIPYRLWIAVRQWAENNGYSFNYPGDMGSMRCLYDPDLTFTPDEPVAHISWHDALVWCNALSELTGHTPVYYTDEKMTQPYRNAITFRIDMYEEYGYPQFASELMLAIGRKGAGIKEVDTNAGLLLYLNAETDGYRLPLAQEFAKINTGTLAGQTFSVEGQPMRTQPVRSGQPDSNGLYEVNGNLFEWSWNPVDSYLDVMGKYDLNGKGCFSMTAEQTAKNQKPYQDLVYNARPYFGLRVARRAD